MAEFQGLWLPTHFDGTKRLVGMRLREPSPVTNAPSQGNRFRNDLRDPVTLRRWHQRRSQV